MFPNLGLPSKGGSALFCWEDIADNPLEASDQKPPDIIPPPLYWQNKAHLWKPVYCHGTFNY